MQETLNVEDGGVVPAGFQIAVKKTLETWTLGVSEDNTSTTSCVALIFEESADNTSTTSCVTLFSAII